MSSDVVLGLVLEAPRGHFLWSCLGLGLETSGLGLGLGLETCGLGLAQWSYLHHCGCPTVRFCAQSDLKLKLHLL